MCNDADEKKGPTDMSEVEIIRIPVSETETIFEQKEQYVSVGAAYGFLFEGKDNDYDEDFRDYI